MSRPALPRRSAFPGPTLPGRPAPPRRPAFSALAAAAVLGALGACGGEVGTIEVSLLTAPGSDLLDRVQRARVEVSSPHTVVEAERGSDGELLLDLEFAAADAAAVFTLEGFDAAGERIALGRSAPLPIAAVSAEIALYVGPPLAFAEAPVALDPPRSEVGAALLPYGAILFGGRGAEGEPLADAVVYNVYDHTLQVGLDLPEARAGATVTAGQGDLVYVFGGIDGDGEESADGWAFNTAVAPSGIYTALTRNGELARAGAAGVLVSGETSLVAGDPAVQVDGTTAQIRAWPDAPAMPGGVPALLGDPASVVLVTGAGLGESGAVTYDGDVFREVDAPAEVRRTGHAVVTLADGRGLVVGGEIEPGVPERSAVVYDAETGEFSPLADFLAAGRTGAAIAATDEVVLVAGGSGADGALVDDAELFDAATLAPIARVPLAVARRGGVALPLPNGQVLLAGGLDADGAPVGTLELFTPGE